MEASPSSMKRIRSSWTGSTGFLSLSMATKKRLYQEGDWFAVPLSGYGYGIGRIARIGSRGGVLLGFFFRNRYKMLPISANYSNLTPADAILVKHFTDAGLMNKPWPILPKEPNWNRADWSSTTFGHVDPVDQSKAYRRIYDDNDPFTMVKEELTSIVEAAMYPREGLAGHIWLQGRLSDLLADEHPQ